MAASLILSTAPSARWHQTQAVPSGVSPTTRNLSSRAGPGVEGWSASTDPLTLPPTEGGIRGVVHTPRWKVGGRSVEGSVEGAGTTSPILVRGCEGGPSVITSIRLAANSRVMASASALLVTLGLASLASR